MSFVVVFFNAVIAVIVFTGFFKEDEILLTAIGSKYKDTIRHDEGITFMKAISNAVVV